MPFQGPKIAVFQGGLKERRSDRGRAGQER